jgi:hypothetical protein
MEPLVMVKARAATIRKACQDSKLDTDMVTAAAFVYLAMKILKLPADHIFEGPISASLDQCFRAFQTAAQTKQSDPSDPNGTVTMTNAELAILLQSINTGKVGEA